MINIENYEEYVLDYLEGNLEEELRVEMKNFLMLHSDIEERLEDLDLCMFERDEITFHGKQLLKKSVDINEFEYYFIAKADGFILPEEEKILEFNFDNNTIKKQVELYSKLKVSPDEEITLSSLNGLYQRRFTLNWSLKASVAAAVIILCVATISIMRREYKETVLPFALVETERISPMEIEYLDLIEPLENSIQTRLVVKQESMQSDIGKVEKFVRMEPLFTIRNNEISKLKHEIEPPQPEEYMVPHKKPYDLLATYNEYRERPFNRVRMDIEESENIFSSMIRTGRNIANRLKKSEEIEEISF